MNAQSEVSSSAAAPNFSRFCSLTINGLAVLGVARLLSFFIVVVHRFVSPRPSCTYQTVAICHTQSTPCHVRHARSVTVTSLCPHTLSHVTHRALPVTYDTHRSVTVTSLCDTQSVVTLPPTPVIHRGASECRHFAPHQGQCRHFTLTPHPCHAQGDIRVSSLCPHPPPRPTGRLQRSC